MTKKKLKRRTQYKTLTFEKKKEKKEIYKLSQ